MQFAKRVDTCTYNIKKYFKDLKKQGQVPKFELTQ